MQTTPADPHTRVSKPRSPRGLYWLLLGLLALFVATRFLLPGASHPRPAVFSDLSLAQAMEATGAEGGILLVKATAAWCGPCKQMDTHTFRDERVVRYFAAPKIALALDVDDHPDEAERLGVRVLPTLIVFKGGQEVARREGFLSAGDLLAWIEQATPEPVKPD